METPKVNPSGVAPGNPQQPASGSTVGLAAKVGATHGSATGVKAAPVKNGPGSKGGRGTREQEVSAYLASRGMQAVPIQTTSAPGIVAPVEPAYVVTPEFVGEVSESLLKGIEAFRVRQVALRVKTLCGDVNLAKEYAESASAPPGCIVTISKSMMEIARKYPAMLQWAPEITLASAFGTWIVKDLENMKRLDALEKRMADSLKAPPAAAKPEGALTTN